jgi:hypothetical protein
LRTSSFDSSHAWLTWASPVDHQRAVRLSEALLHREGPAAGRQPCEEFFREQRLADNVVDETVEALDDVVGRDQGRITIR